MTDLQEYSVVYTDRALNHMSHSFQSVMREISSTLRSVYSADAVVVIPGSGTSGMEAVARQFANGRDVLVIRNGWFSHRWSQILEAGNIASSIDVLSASMVEDEPEAPFAPPDIDAVVDRIETSRPAVVFVPHVETSAGLMLPDAYLATIARAVHGVGGMLVVDAIASGAAWLDMELLDIDVLVSAPQKGWSGPPCAGLVMLGSRAVAQLGETTSSSYTLDLAAWRNIMVAYEEGGHAYHATMPTDALASFAQAMRETVGFRLDRLKASQFELGERVRGIVHSKGFPSVALPGYEAPGVVVAYTDIPELHTGAVFARHGVQVAAGVPLQCGERSDFSTFRVGLFGLDKLMDVDGAVGRFAHTLNAVISDLRS